MERHNSKAHSVDGQVSDKLLAVWANIQNNTCLIKMWYLE